MALNHRMILGRMAILSIDNTNPIQEEKEEEEEEEEEEVVKPPVYGARVPEGVEPGAEFVCSVKGVRYTLRCPEHGRPGDIVHFPLPNPVLPPTPNDVRVEDVKDGDEDDGFEDNNNQRKGNPSRTSGGSSDTNSNTTTTNNNNNQRRNCDGLSVTINNGKTVEAGAFVNCRGLSVTMHNGASVERNAFVNCPGLSVTINNGETVESNAFVN